MSDDHAVRDRITERYVKAGADPAKARQIATDSLKRCDRDKQRDERRRK